MAEWSTNDLITEALMNQKTLYVGAAAPVATYPGQLWMDSDDDTLSQRNNANDAWDELVKVTATYTRHLTLEASNLGNPSANPPIGVIQDNVELKRFTLNTDQIFLNFDLTENEYASGDLVIELEWTNDGNVNDETKEVRWQIDFQTVSGEGDNVDGSHANSPYNSGDDTYDSAFGWISHTATITIPAADFAGVHEILMKLSAVTIGDGTPLTSEPHLIDIHMAYTALRIPS